MAAINFQSHIKYHNLPAKISFFQKLLSILFFLTFTSIILNPAIHGGRTTIYLYLLIPFLDLKFLKYIREALNKGNIQILVLFILIASTLNVQVLKLFFIFYSMSYLIYTYKLGIFYLHEFMLFNILFATLQFTFMVMGLKYFAVAIGPQNIANMLYGSYATESNTAFYTIFLFPRVSGLSREPGFFAALLQVCFFLLIIDKKNFINKNKYKIFFAFYAWGLFISFSKSTYALFIVMVLYFMRDKFKKIPAVFTFIIFTSCMIIIASYMDSINFLATNKTWAHRFGGFYALTQVNIMDILNGLNPQDNFDKYASSLDFASAIYGQSSTNGLQYCGIGHLLINIGLLPTLILLSLISIFSIDSFYLLTLILFTIDADFFAITSFAVIAYFILIFNKYMNINEN